LTWLRAVADDVKLMNLGIHSARQKAVDREGWHRVVRTATHAASSTLEDRQTDRQTDRETRRIRRHLSHSVTPVADDIARPS